MSPAPAHFPLLMMLSEQPRTLTELALLRGVSLPTKSNSIAALVHHGWARRAAPATDRTTVVIAVTSSGRAAVGRVGRCAEGHLADALSPLDAGSLRRLQAGLSVPPHCRTSVSNEPYISGDTKGIGHA